MLDCKQFWALTGAVLEGEGQPEAYAHLAACPRCRVLVDELGAVERAARSLPLHQPSPRLWERLRAAAAREGLWTQPSWQWSAPAWIPLPARPAFATLLGVTLLVATGLVGSATLELPLAQTTPATAFEVAQGELVQEAGYAARYEKHLQQVEYSVLADEAVPADTEMRDLCARPLNTVDRAIEQTQLRLNEYPDDSLAREELRRLYQQKAVVLQAMSDPVWSDISR